MTISEANYWAGEFSDEQLDDWKQSWEAMHHFGAFETERPFGATSKPVPLANAMS